MFRFSWRIKMCLCVYYLHISPKINQKYVNYNKKQLVKSNNFPSQIKYSLHIKIKYSLNFTG